MANQQSFLPEDYLEKRRTRRTNVFCLGLFVIVMAGVVAAFMVTDRQRAEVRAHQEQINRDFEKAAAQLERLDELQDRKQRMVQKAKVTSMLIERLPRTLLLSELINNMPPNLSLLELTMETRVLPKRSSAQTALDQAKLDNAKAGGKPVAPEPEVNPTEVTIYLVGVAPTDVQVAAFMTSLGKTAFFTELNLSFSEETQIENQTMRKFRVEMKVNQDVDVQKIEPLMVRRELKQNPMGSKVVLDPGNAPATPRTVAPQSPAPQQPSSTPATPVSDKH